LFTYHGGYAGESVPTVRVPAVWVSMVAGVQDGAWLDVPAPEAPAGVVPPPAVPPVVPPPLLAAQLTSSVALAAIER
jgi:hypothetical protein